MQLLSSFTFVSILLLFYMEYIKLGLQNISKTKNLIKDLICLKLMH
jgi:hypothetical protein